MPGVRGRHFVLRPDLFGREENRLEGRVSRDLVHSEIQLQMKLVRYFFVGGFAAAVDFSIFFLAVKGLGLPWFTVGIVSFVAAT
jgi:hypothetical protein